MKNYLQLSLPFMVLLVLSLLISGCAASAQETPDALSADQPAGAGLPSGNDGGLIISDPAAGLGDLASYHATLNLEFDGINGGEPAGWSRSYDLMVASGTTVQSLLEMQYIEQNQDESGTTRLIADAEGYRYEKINQEACTSIASEQTTGLLELWELAGFLPGINGAVLVGEDTIESILTYHYQFDELALGQSDLTESSGEVWVAADSGAVLRFSLIQKADASYFGEGIEGTLKWSYQVAEINQPQRFNLPGDCQPPLVLEVPVPADASDLSQQETLLSFTTSLSEGEVADYYRQNLETLGWQPIDTLAFEMSGFDFGDLDLSGFDDENFNWEDFDESQIDDIAAEDGSDFSYQAGQSTEGIYRFERGNEILTLLLVPDGEQMLVVISLSRSEPTPE